jgi:predicted CoA-substrate-specific enzyme activase
MATGYYLGVDVGSVSTNLVVIDENGYIMKKIYLRTEGKPILSVQKGLDQLGRDFKDHEILGAGVTGSGRKLIGKVIGADLVKNEITAHGVAALHVHPGVKTVFEIGGQDSKIIIIREGTVVDFAMNTVCAAGTGSFLDQQAKRLNLSLEEFGELALRAQVPVRIAGRCSVFAESDMIHKQQMGYKLEDIVAGLCEALMRNYFNNVGKGKEILPPVLFQGGVAANKGIKAAFEKELGYEITIPEHYEVMGAWGAALLARKAGKKKGFRGFSLSDREIRVESFECPDCPNCCEIVTVVIDGEAIPGWGGRCGKWEKGVSRATG